MSALSISTRGRVVSAESISTGGRIHRVKSILALAIQVFMQIKATIYRQKYRAKIKRP